MATDIYQEILQQIGKLSPGEQREVLAELRRRSNQPAPAAEAHSILELEGLGAEVWHDIDAQEYVRRERGSWSG